MNTKLTWFLFFVTCAIGTLLCVSCSLSAKSRIAGEPADAFPVFAIQVSDSIIFEIDPRIELLSGVQAHTSWAAGSRGPGDAPDRYNLALAAFFEPYKKHPAVRRSNSLTRIGFTYDAPPGFVLSTSGDSAMLPPAEGWSDYLAKRAGFLLGRQRLNDFAAELSDLNAVSNFSAFLQDHADDYQAWLQAAASSFDWERLGAWMDCFYGKSGLPTLYHYVLAPAMFPGGGYGFFHTEKDAAGNDIRRHVYQIIRNSRDGRVEAASGEPEFPTAESLALLGLHEFGHSYVNPALEDLVQSADYNSALTALYKPVASQMRKMAYPSMPIYMNELLIRAITIIGAEDLGLATPLISEMLVRREYDQGFYPVRFVMDTIRDLQAAHGAQSVFTDWLPGLLDALAAASAKPVFDYASGQPSSNTVDQLPPVTAFSFTAASVALPEAWDPSSLFTVSIGAQLGVGGLRSTEIGLQPDTLRSRSLVLSGSAATSYWLTLSRSVQVQAGRLQLRYSARGSNIQREGKQYGGTYVGFIVTDSTGKRSFIVQQHQGSFDWSDYELTLEVDPAKVQSIELTIFLNESGELAVDTIDMAYR